MGVAIDRCPQESLDRLLCGYTRDELPGEQATDGAQELQVDQRRRIDIGLPPEASSNRTVRTLVT